MILKEKQLNQLRELGCELSNCQREKVELYVKELSFYNSRLSLVNYIDNQDLFDNHILDCLAPIAFFRSTVAMNWADVGSGAGLPGILLAIVLPERSFTLIERSQRRCNFLEAVSLRLGLKNVRILSIDLERTTDRFDAVVFRAFRSLLGSVFLLKGILNERGVLFAYKGRLCTSESEREAVDHLFSQTNLKILKTSSQKERCLLVLTK